MRMFESCRPGLRVWPNSDSEMQRFESCRPSQPVRLQRVLKRTLPDNLTLPVTQLFANAPPSCRSGVLFDFRKPRPRRQHECKICLHVRIEGEMETREGIQ